MSLMDVEAVVPERIVSVGCSGRPRPSLKARAALFHLYNSHYSILPFIALMRSSISALTASRLKLAPRCIGG